MRKFFAMLGAVLALCAFSTADEAKAGSTTYYICRIGVAGSQCANLPNNYSLPGVRKPQCDARNCNNGTVDFKLTRGRIDCLSRWVNTSTMVPGGSATIYAPDK